MARRVDIVAEVDDALDGSGNYTGEWIDTGGIQRVRLSKTGGGSVPVASEQSLDETTAFGASAWANGAEQDLTARYFRFVVNGGTPNQPFKLSIRVVG